MGNLAERAACVLLCMGLAACGSPSRRATDGGPSVPDASRDGGHERKLDGALDGGRDSAQPDGGSCEEGLTRCDGVCVDTQTDGDHCGGCESSCRLGTTCEEGVCTSIDCGPDLTWCVEDGCVDLDTSSAHCGGCGERCPEDVLCFMGECTPPDCDEGETWCGADGCVDTQSNADHCGSCDTACSGEPCVAGSCGVDPGPPIPVDWVVRVGDTEFDALDGLALDASGNVYVAGTFNGTVNFGGGDLTSTGMGDIAVASFAPDGTHRWSTRFGGSDEDKVGRLAVGPSDRVYVSGGFTESIDFDGTSYAAEGLRDGFLASFESDGTPQWLERVGGTGDADFAVGVAVDSAGHLWASGHVEGTVDFGDGELEPDFLDVYVAKYDASGALLHSELFVSPDNQYAKEIAVGESDDVYFTGAFFESVDFGDGELSAAGGPDIFVVSFSSDGTVRWSEDATGVGDDISYALAADGDGAWISAALTDSITVDGSDVSSRGRDDGWVAAFDTDGTYLRSHTFGGNNTIFAGERAAGVALDDTGRVYAVGGFGRTTAFGTRSFRSAGALDIFVAVWNADGSPAWAQTYGGPLSEEALRVVPTSDGSAVYVAGGFRDSVDFGGELLTSAGASDGFLLKLVP